LASGRGDEIIIDMRERCLRETINLAFGSCSRLSPITLSAICLD